MEIPITNAIYSNNYNYFIQKTLEFDNGRNIPFALFYLSTIFYDIKELFKEILVNALSDDYPKIQGEFERLKAQLPSVLPESFSDIIWDREEMKKAKAHFDNDRRNSMTLSLPKNYTFYDDTL